MQNVGLSVLHRVALRFGPSSRLRFPLRSRRSSPTDQGPRTPDDSPSSHTGGFFPGLFGNQLDSYFLDCSLCGVLS